MRTFFPTIGTVGMICSSHPIATQVGMSILERGGNAFDAATAAALTLHVVMPDQTGPAGEVVAAIYDRRHGVDILCGQGSAPAAASVAQFDALGLQLIPRNGLLPAVTPGAFDAWLLLLEQRGSMSLEAVLEPALHYASRGFPITPRTVAYIQRGEKLFTAHWKSTAELYMPGGRIPAPNEMIRNEPYAQTLRRILAEAKQAGGSRENRIAAARAAFLRGFVAESIDRFCRKPAMDDTGREHAGFMTGDDLWRWQASFEAPLMLDYAGFTVAKPGPWSQGPVFLQQLQLLKGFGLKGIDASGPDFCHLVIECAKLAFADKAHHYGDPLHANVPMVELLSEAYADERRALIRVDAASSALQSGLTGPSMRPEVGSSDTLHLPRDTAHIDAVDSSGNMISATPSGGWFDESPILPDLGFPLSTRGQHFLLNADHPNGLAPGKRPVTTLSATVALKDGEPSLAFGTPGGDQQDQWPLIFFLRHVHAGMDIAEANAAPMFYTRHMISSYAPFKVDLLRAFVEHTMPGGTVDELRRRGHDVRVIPAPDDYYAARNFGTLSAVSWNSGVLQGVGSPRWPHSYCAGR